MYRGATISYKTIRTFVNGHRGRNILYKIFDECSLFPSDIFCSLTLRPFLIRSFSFCVLCMRASIKDRKSWRRFCKHLQVKDSCNPTCYHLVFEIPGSRLGEVGRFCLYLCNFIRLFSSFYQRVGSEIGTEGVKIVLMYNVSSWRSCLCVRRSVIENLSKDEDET